MKSAAASRAPTPAGSEDEPSTSRPMTARAGGSSKTATEEPGVYEDPDFWVYYQPVVLYSTLASRPASFLRRNLKYAAGPPTQPPSDPCRGTTLEVQVSGTSGTHRGPATRGLSLVAAVCERLSNKLDYKPVAARLLQLPSWNPTVLTPSSSSATPAAATAAAAAAVSAGLATRVTRVGGAAVVRGRIPAAGTRAVAAAAAAAPAAAAAAATSTSAVSAASCVVALPSRLAALHQPHLVFVVSEHMPDVASCFGKPNGRALSTDLEGGTALGLLRPGDWVWAGSVPLADLQQQQEQQNEEGDNEKKRDGRQRPTKLSLTRCQAGICVYTVGEHAEEVRTLQLLPSPSPSDCQGHGIEALRLDVQVSVAGSQAGATSTAPGGAAVAGASDQAGRGAGVSSGAAEQPGNAAGGVGQRRQQQQQKQQQQQQQQQQRSGKSTAEPPPRATALRAGGRKRDGGVQEQTEARPSKRSKPGAAAEQQQEQQQQQQQLQEQLHPSCSQQQQQQPQQQPSAYCSRRSVLFLFIYGTEHHQKVCRQLEPGFGCCLCGVRCRDSAGLMSHMEASHSYLTFEFMEGSAALQVLPAAATVGVQTEELAGVVMVRMPLTAFCRATGRLLARPERMISSVDGSKGHAVVNSFVFHRRMSAPLDLNPEITALLDEAAPQPLPLPLPQLLPPLPLPNPVPKDPQSARRVGKAQGAGPGRATAGHASASAAPILPISLQDRQYYHARTVVPMTREEVLAPTARQAGGLGVPPVPPVQHQAGDAGHREEVVDTDDEMEDEEYERFFRRCFLESQAVSTSERRLMLLWNQFTRRHPVFSDYIVPARCTEFVAGIAPDVRACTHLRRSLTTFLLLLWDHGLVGAGTIDACMRLCGNEGQGGPGREQGPAALGQEAVRAAAQGTEAVTGKKKGEGEQAPEQETARPAATGRARGRRLGQVQGSGGSGA